MNPTFARHVESLHPKFEALLACQPYTYDSLPRRMPMAGIYLFSSESVHLYVGRSNEIRSRLGRHCLPSAGHNKAAFAFRLARIATGRTEAAYRAGNGTRAELMADETFRNAFEKAKADIRAMTIRFVEEADPVRQALLEMYAAVSLGTVHNSFDNH